MGTTLKTIMRNLTGRTDEPPLIYEVIESEPKSRVHPLTRSVSEIIMDKYRDFTPVYRYGLDTEEADLCDVRFHEELDLYVGLYRASNEYGEYEYFLWGWRDGAMLELEQRNVREVREIDRRGMKKLNRWLS